MGILSVQDLYVASSYEFKVIAAAFEGVEGLWNFRLNLEDFAVLEMTVSSHPAKRDDWFLQPSGFRIRGVIAPEGIPLPSADDVRAVQKLAMVATLATV